MQSKMIEDGFRDICNIGIGYERAKGYCRAEFNTLDASCITDAKTMKKLGWYYKCRAPHFQSNWTDHRGNSSNELQTKTAK